MKHGAPVNYQREADLFTALHLACAAGLVEAARALIEGGADVDAVASEDVMPIHCAESCKSAVEKKQILLLLREKDAKRSVSEVLAGLRGALGGANGEKTSITARTGYHKVLVSTSNVSSDQGRQRQVKKQKTRPVVTTMLSGFSGSVGKCGKLIKQVVSTPKQNSARKISDTHFHFSLGDNRSTVGVANGGGGTCVGYNGNSSSNSSKKESGQPTREKYITSTTAKGENAGLIDRVVLEKAKTSRKYATIGVDAH